ncbi:MAG: TRAP transporter permease, partial [Deltaproteobacteria bacterium]|nr:TRAP transporter permease [Deltaproteobacteria bacterium]
MILGFFTKKQREPADELLKAETGAIRNLRPFEFYLVAFIAISWALFQLALADFIIVESTKERAIHLAFAISLLFLVHPCLKKPRKFFGFLAVINRIPFIDYLFAVLSALAALYLLFDYEGISMRAGIPITRD